MKKMFKILSLAGLVAFSANSFAADATSTLPHMTQAQLKANDGQNGHKAYVALNGKVYDVSKVDEWKGGKHYKGMVAGTDLSSNIHLSPHGPGIVNDLNLKPIALYP